MRDTENDKNSLKTLEVIDNAYKYVKNKKIQDVLLPEIKNDISDFIQNEVKQKINLHNQEEYQTVVDKKLITNLERETEFFKSEISTKNEIIKNFLIISVRIKAVIWWGKHGTLMLLMKQVIASRHAVHLTQKVL